MRSPLDDELAGLDQMTIVGLCQRYAEVFGEPPPSTGNKTWLIRRIAWRLQAVAEGDLSERARRRAAELANDADLRLNPPPSSPETATLGRPVDPRLPRPGTILTRRYKGEVIRVKVLADGFQYADVIYPSLSAVAKAVTGSHCNGFLFFRLTKEKRSGPDR
jgi:hypothetical protein